MVIAVVVTDLWVERAREYLLVFSLSPKAVYKDGENKRRSNNHTILDVESTYKRGN